MAIPLGGGTVCRVSGTRWRERLRVEERSAIACAFLNATASLSNQEVGEILGISGVSIRRWRITGAPKKLYEGILQRMAEYLQGVEPTPPGSA